jgi:RNA polymerase sigma factor (sigma-70 family)
LVFLISGVTFAFSPGLFPKIRNLEGSYINIHQAEIDGCRKGDRDSQFRIYKLYYKAMYNTALRIVNDTAEAEDIMQESFLDAFRRIESYSGEGSFGSWLKRIVINNSLDALRRSQEVISIDEMNAEIAEPVEESDQEELQLRVSEVKSAIAGLPEDYRVIVSLFLLEGYDHEEISEILKISNQLSRTRFSRARQRLIQMLKERQEKGKEKEKGNYIYN